MSKDKNLMKKIKEHNGSYFEGIYMYTISHCTKCDEDFVLQEHDNPAFDGPRVLEFYDVCGDCL